MEASSSSLVFKAKTALHSAAARAEKVLTDIRADFKNEIHRDKEGESEAQKPADDIPGEEALGQEPRGDIPGEVQSETNHPKWKPRYFRHKQDWQSYLKNVKKGNQDTDEKAEVSIADCSLISTDDNNSMDQGNQSQIEGSNKGSIGLDDSSTSTLTSIPPASILRHLGVAAATGKKFKSPTDVLALSKDSERVGSRFSAMKSLVLREKEDKVSTGNGDSEETNSLIHFLFDAEEHLPRMNSGAFRTFSTAYMPREMHGAPPESFVFHLSKIMGSFKTLRKMASFWQRVVVELRGLWSEGQPVPRIPLDEIPDLNYCLLHQQLQVFNCCIARKWRRHAAIESLDSVMKEPYSYHEDSVDSLSKPSSSSVLYARTVTGDLVLRLGASHPSDNLAMLETGEPVYSPVTQEGPLLTEDLIRENEEFVLRTGSVGAGCSQLLSDMQAFKAANPGCILEDFVRWHSPPDWAESDSGAESDGTCNAGDSSSRRGRLSNRMQKEGNLWRELWETAKALPAVKQSPLFDEDLAVDGILNVLEDIPPSELFEQLFVSLLSAGFVIAEAALPTDSTLSKLFYDCKEYATSVFQKDPSGNFIDDVCKVYETVEAIMRDPDEALVIMKRSEDSNRGESRSLFRRLRLTLDEGLVILPPPEDTISSEPKGRFGKFNLSFANKDKQLFCRSSSKEQKNLDETNKRVFPNIFDGKKSSVFSRPQAKALADKEITNIDENDWTIL